MDDTEPDLLPDEGVPIDRYCQSKVEVRERLRLFRGVLAAIHYAHQRCAP